MQNKPEQLCSNLILSRISTVHALVFDYLDIPILKNYSYTVFSWWFVYKKWILISNLFRLLLRFVQNWLRQPFSLLHVSFYRNLYFGNWCLKKLVRLLHRSVRESATSASYWLSSSWWAWTLPLELTPPNLSYLNNSRWVNYCQQKPGSRKPREIFSHANNI